MNKTNAIITKTDSRHEVRCGLCGKLLFVMNENSKNTVDISALNVIIVARCTRNSCKADNQISFKNIKF